MSRTRALVGGVVTGVVALLATAVPASAHDELITSDPTADAVLASVPEHVTLTFSAELLDLGAAIIVADAAGDDWVAGEPVLDGTEISVPVDPAMPPDAGYEVRWRVVSSDGHPISGVIPFVVGDGEPLVRDDGTAAAGTAPTAAPDAQDTPVRPTDTDAGPTRVLLVGAGGALLALAALLLFSRLRGRTAAAPDDTADVPPSDTLERH